MRQGHEEARGVDLVLNPIGEKALILKIILYGLAAPFVPPCLFLRRSRLVRYLSRNSGFRFTKTLPTAGSDVDENS